MRYRIETERENLFDVNMMIAMRVRLNDMPPFECISDAFYKAVRTYEILCSRVVIEDSGEAFYVDCDTPGSSFAESVLSFEELINVNEKIRFKVEDGEYIRGFSTSDGIVFLMHHLGGDGKSLLFFIESFMRILSGEEVSKIGFGRLAVSDMPEESKLPKLYELLINHWNKKWAKVRRVFTFEDLDRAFNDFWKEHETVTTLTEYGKPELDRMIKESKKAGSSLMSYLIADLIKDWKFKADVGLAVDGRQDNSRLMGNYATGIHVNYRFDKTISVCMNAVRFNRLMRSKLSDPRVRYSVLHFVGRLDPTLIDSVCLEAVGAYHSRLSSQFAEIMSYGKKKRDLSITNLMRADIPVSYGEYEIKDIAFVPPVVSYGKNLYGIITVNDRMIISHHTYK
jgi:hypothetical protein